MGNENAEYYLAKLEKDNGDYKFKLKLIAEIDDGTNGNPFLLCGLSDEERAKILTCSNSDFRKALGYDLELSIPYSTTPGREPFEKQLDKIYNSCGTESDYHYVVFNLAQIRSCLYIDRSSRIVFYPDHDGRPITDYIQYEDVLVPAKFEHCYPVLRMEDLFLYSCPDTGKKFVRFHLSPEYANLFLEIPSFRKVFVDPDSDDEATVDFLPGPYCLSQVMDDPSSKDLVCFELQRDTESRPAKGSCIPREDFLFPESILCTKEKNDEQFLLTVISLEDAALEEKLSRGEKILSKWKLPSVSIKNLLEIFEDQPEVSADENICIQTSHYNIAEDKLWTDPEKLREYLIARIQKFRPTYTKDVIENIAICITQGFLTVFSGAPGCGKTSICDMFADALGLTDQIAKYAEPESMKDTDTAKRYISVSVEQGWTSKRDFIGYYNPLFHEMSQSNHEVYEKFEQLDAEKNNKKEIFPCIILLDEANLSPMEYYWSDFMKIGDEFFDFTINPSRKKGNACDNLPVRFTAKIERGDGKDFHFSETLRFLATMNNDYSTSPLSPRLTDRAWVITLPEPDTATGEMPDMDIKSDNTDASDNGKIVTWEMLRAAFDYNPAPQIDNLWNDDSNEDVRKIYKEVVNTATKLHISVSPRTARVIKRYWAVAAQIFGNGPEKVIEKGSAILALDYAVAQKILPHIDGDGPEYRSGLEALSKVCEERNLLKSHALIEKIIADGEQMNFYKFFH